MNIIQCSNKCCHHTFRVEDNRHKGLCNDKYIYMVECPECKSITPIQVYNTPKGSCVKGGKAVKVLEGGWNDHQELQQPLLLSAPNGLDLKDNHLKWSFKDYSLWADSKYDFELQSTFLLLANRDAINHNMAAYYNIYVKGKGAEESYYIQNYKIGNLNANAVWAKKTPKPQDLNCDSFYLVHHSRIDLQKKIDGLYTRDEAKIILERLLVRWKFLSSQVIIATPFIGFNYPNRLDEVHQLWEWLDDTLDMSKTKILTRRATYKLLQQSQNMTKLNADERVSWEILDDLNRYAEKVIHVRKTKTAEEYLDNAPVSFFEKFHAKFYAGVFKDYVEVLVGSYNVHTGKYYDNLIFKRYTREQFLELYMHKLCPLFRYKDSVHDRVHILEFSNPNKTVNNVFSFDELLKSIDF